MYLIKELMLSNVALGSLLVLDNMREWRHNESVSSYRAGSHLINDVLVNEVVTVNPDCQQLLTPVLISTTRTYYSYSYTSPGTVQAPAT